MREQVEERGFRRLTEADFSALTALQLCYKQEIGEDMPDEAALLRLQGAISDGRILFFGCEAQGRLLGLCSVTRGFSTFHYDTCGVFEDFYILPEYRHQGIARALAALAWRESGVKSMTVGCADCDRAMYETIGFRVRLGNLLAWEDQ